MNIFVTSNCPVESAIALDNRRLVKMILESAQLLSTAIAINLEQSSNQNSFLVNLYDSLLVNKQIYKPTHKKHPCTIWTAHSLSNWQWLFKHFQALGNEYTYRYNNYHKSLGISDYLVELSTMLIPNIEPSPFVNATRSKKYNLDFTTIADTYQAYRLYLTGKWLNESSQNPQWKKRSKPIWFDECRELLIKKLL